MDKKTKLVYHYTSFEKLKCILQNGTIRFKESTKSNDMLDTLGIVNKLKNIPHYKSSELLNIILGYYQRENYKPKSVSLVSCFSKLSDSRLLWDAYTMNRPAINKCTYGENKFCFDSSLKYDGVCIAFKIDKLKDLLTSYEKTLYDKVNIQSILYGDNHVLALINNLFKDTIAYSCDLSKDTNQEQNIISNIMITPNKECKIKKTLVYPMKKFIDEVEINSPFFKHCFWKEEQEVRASLFIADKNSEMYTTLSEYDGAKILDVPIDEECIDHIVLGPEFDDLSFNVINQISDCKLNFFNIKHKQSMGTGVIRNQ